MSDRVYRQAFFMALATCVGLAAGVGYLLLHRNNPIPVAQTGDPVVARGPADSGPPSKQSVVPPSVEPQLGPIQISPQRLQQIGVTTAVAQTKNVSDKLSVPGNVEIDEQSLSYVQTRFAGWIQNVFANATYQYVKKGQRLFTIYSPDLVSTEAQRVIDIATGHGVSGWKVNGAGGEGGSVTLLCGTGSGDALAGLDQAIRDADPLFEVIPIRLSRHRLRAEWERPP